jgi:uracil-DNA glycosylase family 4
LSFDLGPRLQRPRRAWRIPVFRRAWEEIRLAAKPRTVRSSLIARHAVAARRWVLTNPSTLQFDSDEIGPWTLWQGNLDAEILVVGQDWGDVEFFVRHAGNEVGVPNPTNKALQRLLASTGISIPPPQVDPRAGSAFFTNAILCLKRNGLQAKVPEACFRNCASFLRRQIEIVSPNVVIALGYAAYRAVCRAFELQSLPRLSDAVARELPEQLPTGAKLVAVYHCGNRGMRARSFEQQTMDWQRVRHALCAEPQAPR